MSEEFRTVPVPTCDFSKIKCSNSKPFHYRNSPALTNTGKTDGSSPDKSRCRTDRPSSCKKRFENPSESKRNPPRSRNTSNSEPPIPARIEPRATSSSPSTGNSRTKDYTAQSSIPYASIPNFGKNPISRQVDRRTTRSSYRTRTLGSTKNAGTTK